MKMLRRIPYKFAATLIVLGCFVALARAGNGHKQGFLSEPNAIKDGMAAILEKTGPRVRAFSVEIAVDRMTLLAQDAGNRRRIQEWRFETVEGVFRSGKEVAGPFEPQPALINPDLEANLFDLAEVDFAAADALIKSAIERAALDEPGHVTAIAIKRRIFISPPGSGDVEWSVHVAGDWPNMEDAYIYANARGTIRGAELQRTNRAARFDLFKQPEFAEGAGKAFREGQGAGKLLLKVGIGKRGVSFETNRTYQGGPLPLSGSLSWNARFRWEPYSFCGGCLEPQRIGGINYDQVTGGARFTPFSIDDVEWAAVPRIIRAAREKLAMPEGQITGIDLSIPTDTAGTPQPVWRVDMTDRTGERGWIKADRAGAVLQVKLPEGRAKPTDWLEPAAMMNALARAERDYGAQRKVRTIRFSRDSVTLTGEDPQRPGALADMRLTDEGFSRSSAIGPSLAPGAPFTLADLSSLSAENIVKLKSGAIARLKPLDYPIEDIYIERNAASRKGAVTVEVRAWEQGPAHNWGAVIYELNGTFVTVVKP
jgi:hypothetical protein